LKDLLRVDTEHLQDRSVMTLDPHAVDKLEIELEGKKWIAVRGKDTKWDLEQPEKKSNMDAWPISSILWELKDTEWKSIKRDGAENLAAAHLDKPKLVISLFKNDEKEPIVFKAGWEDVKPEKSSHKAEQATEEKAAREEGPDKTVTAARPALPPTMNVIVEPSEEKGAVFVVDSGFVDRLQMDLERLLEKKK